MAMSLRVTLAQAIRLQQRHRKAIMAEVALVPQLAVAAVALAALDHQAAQVHQMAVLVQA